MSSLDRLCDVLLLPRSRLLAMFLKPPASRSAALSSLDPRHSAVGHDVRALQPLRVLGLLHFAHARDGRVAVLAVDGKILMRVLAPGAARERVELLELRERVEGEEGARASREVLAVPFVVAASDA